MSSKKVTFRHSLKAALAASRFASTTSVDRSSFEQEELSVLRDMLDACRTLEQLLQSTPNALVSDLVLNNAAQHAASAAGASSTLTEKRAAHWARLEATQLAPNLRKLTERSMDALFRTASAAPPGCTRAGASSWLHRESASFVHLWSSATAAARFMKASQEVSRALLDFRIEGVYCAYSTMCTIQGQHVSATALPPLLVAGSREVRFYPRSPSGAQAAACEASGATGDGSEPVVATDGSQVGPPSSIIELMALQLHAVLGLAADKPIRLRRGADGRYYFMAWEELIESRTLVVRGVASCEGYFSRAEAIRTYNAECKPKGAAPTMAAVLEFVTKVLVPRAAKELLGVFATLSADERAVGAFVASGRIPKICHQVGVNLCFLQSVADCVRNANAPLGTELLPCIHNEMIGRIFGRMAQIDIAKCNQEGLDTLSDRVDIVNRLATFVATKDQQFWNEHLVPFMRAKYGAANGPALDSSVCHAGAILKRLSLSTGCEYDGERGRFERFQQVPLMATTRAPGWLPDEASAAAAMPPSSSVPVASQGTAAAPSVIVERRRKQLLDEFEADARTAAEQAHPFLHCAMVSRLCAALVDVGKGSEAVSQLLACQADNSAFAVPAALAPARELLLFRLRLVCLEGVAVEKRLSDVEKIEEMLARFHEGMMLRAAETKLHLPGKALLHDADALVAVAFLAHFFQASTRARPTFTHSAVMCQSVANLLASTHHTDVRVNTAAMALVGFIEPLVESADNDAVLRSVYVVSEQMANCLARLRCHSEAIRYLEKVLWRAIGTPAEAHKPTAMMAILIVERMTEWDCVDEFDQCVALYIAALSTMCVVCRSKEATLKMTTEDAAVLNRRQKLRDTIRKVMERIRNVHVDQWFVAATNNIPLTLIYRVEELLRSNSDESGCEELFGAIMRDEGSEGGLTPKDSFGGAFVHRLSVVVAEAAREVDSRSKDDGGSSGEGSVLIVHPSTARRVEDRTGMRLAELIRAHIRRVSPSFYAVALAQRIGRGYLDGRCAGSLLGQRVRHRRSLFGIERAEMGVRVTIVEEWEAALVKITKKEASERKLIARGRRVGSVWSVVAKSTIAVKPTAKQKAGKSPLPSPRDGADEGHCKQKSKSSTRTNSPAASSCDDGPTSSSSPPPRVQCTPPPSSLVHKASTARDFPRYSDQFLSPPRASLFASEVERQPAYMDAKGATRHSAVRRTLPSNSLEEIVHVPIRKRTFTPEPIVIISEKLETRIYTEDEIRERLKLAEATAHEMFLRRMGYGLDWSKASAIAGGGSKKARGPQRPHHLQPLSTAGAKAAPVHSRSKSSLR